MNPFRKVQSFFQRLTGATNAYSRLRPGSGQRARHDAGATASAGLPRLGLAQQWLRLASIISSASITAKHVDDLQKSATDQLDAAYYNLNILLDDVATVMLLPSHIVAMQERKPHRRALAAGIIARPAIASGFSAAA